MRIANGSPKDKTVLVHPMDSNEHCIFSVTQHDAKLILSAGLSVASPWFIRGEFR